MGASILISDDYNTILRWLIIYTMGAHTCAVFPAGIIGLEQANTKYFSIAKENSVEVILIT
jgi:ABC-type uncharacterized transport system permease subunit